MKPIIAVFLISTLGILMTCNSAWAQATAQISGAVQDESQAVLPGVGVTATQTETGISRMTITNETGYYVLPNLPIGPYKLEAVLPGFRTFVQSGIVLQVNSNPTINVTMRVGQVTEQIEVQANASLVETRSLSVAQVMETSRIMELPLNGRNAQELVLLGGGAVQVTPPGGQAGFSDRLTISAAGSIGASMEYTLDGIRHLDVYDGLGLPLPFPDALSEFKTEIGGLSAQAARGSQVSAVTKSGTNEFHGSLFEFVRNDLFNARNYYATKGSTLKRNQFGGDVGGPVIRNRLFFFGGYQGTTIRQDPSDTRQFVPTAAMLAGDFTAFASAACNTRGAINLRDPFANNRIDPALFSPVAAKIAARLPKTQNPCGEITYGTRTVTNNGQLVSKIDYQSSTKHSLFGRYLYTAANDDVPFDSNNVLTAGTSAKARSFAFTFGSTYLLSSSTVNAFRLAVTRGKQAQVAQKFFDLTELGARVYSGEAPGISDISVTSGFTLAGNTSSRRTVLYQLADDVSMTRGKHQFGFGGRVGHSRSNIFITGSVKPTFTFSGEATGAGLADFLLGRASNYSQGRPALTVVNVNYVSLYGQDTWQARPRLSVSYGLRWSPILPQVDRQRPVPNVSNFILERYRQGLRSKVFINAPPGLVYPGDPELAQENNGANAEKPAANLWNPYWNVFAPRIGLAWDIEGNGRTSLRASYGISFEEYPTVYRLGSAGAQPPWGSLTRIISPAGGLDNPWQGIPGGNPFPLQLTKDLAFVPLGEYLPSNPDLFPTYTQSWNVSLQREVVKDTLLSVSYMGTEVTHLQAASPLNMAIYVPGNGDAGGNCFVNGQAMPFKVNPGAPCSTVGNTQDRRQLSILNPAFKNEIGRLSVIVNGGTQSYNGMLLSVQRRAMNGVSVSANYTLSHCIGDYMGRSNSGYGSSVGHTYQDPNNRRRDRGNCEQDQRHNFNMTGLVETPQFAGRALRLVGSGWRLSGLYRRTTGGNIVAANAASGVRTITLGTPTNAIGSSSGGDRCLCDIDNQRPNQVLENVYLNTSRRPDTQWLNPAAFAQPAVGTLGNMGRATLRLPPTWQFDMALARVFRFRETQSLEFRAEAYNLTNSFRPGTINTTLSASTFGKIRTSLDPRILQFALKYLF